MWVTSQCAELIYCWPRDNSFHWNMPFIMDPVHAKCM
jgi:hypothetical protein